MGMAGAGAQSPWSSGSAEGAGAPMGAVHTHQELPAVPFSAWGCPVGLCWLRAVPSWSRQRGAGLEGNGLVPAANPTQAGFNSQTRAGPAKLHPRTKRGAWFLSCLKQSSGSIRVLPQQHLGSR